MITIFIDNKPYQVKEGQNLLQACLSLGFDLPYFCWHPAMHSVGACRQCAVKQFKDDKDTRGRIVMSCMTPLAEGMRISVDDPEAKAFRASVIEWLMVNHPHDCPVCDEGGECHLQDMTVMTGHTYRRTRFKKRTHRNQDLGPFINHEMNRCIACYRCIRFYRNIAGGRDLNVFASHDHVYFGRHDDGALENEFSGNLVEVCPTGVFTDKTFKKQYTRKWDLQTAPSICVHCGLGCNTIIGERYGTLRRVLNRYNNEVNGYFLCDRGRFGYEFVNSDLRIRKPLVKLPLSPSGSGQRDGGLQTVDRETALKHIANILSKSKTVIGIGSPRASLESNFALRTFVGAENFYSGMTAKDHHLVSLIIDILRNGPARTPSLHDVETADAVLVLGEDITNTAPMLALALRQSVWNKPKEMTTRVRIPPWDDNAVRNAVQDATGPLTIATFAGTKLDDVASRVFHAAPDDLVRLGFAIAHALDPHAPAVPDCSADILSLAEEIARVLKDAKRPLIISGTSLGSAALVQAAANIAWTLCEIGNPAELCYTVPECNSLGLGLMAGKKLDEAFKAAQKSETDVIILENDLYRRADQKIVDTFLDNAANVIVIDHISGPTSAKAGVALPAGTFAESSGTFVNNEGRAQRFYQAFVPQDDIQASWQWIRDIMAAAGRSVAQWRTLDDITSNMISAIPLFGPVQDIAMPADFTIHGQKIPRQPHRYSGRTAMLADVTVHEPKPPEDPDSPLAFTMEGYDGQPPAPFIARYWRPGWSSVQSLNKFQQEVGGPLQGGDPGKRLINPGRAGHAPYFMNIPGAFTPRDNEWLIVPFSQIFGSEELSVLSPGIAERASRSYLVMSPDDAAHLKVQDNDLVTVPMVDTTHRFIIKIDPAIPVGTAGFFARAAVSPGSGEIQPGRIKKGCLICPT